LKVETLKVETLKVETLKVETLKVETLKVETLKVETFNVKTFNLQHPHTISHFPNRPRQKSIQAWRIPTRPGRVRHFGRTARLR
jgi:hypothetical protein